MRPKSGLVNKHRIGLAGLCIAAGLSLAWLGQVQSSSPAQATPTAKRPNILLVLADDLAYSDIGAYGGEIDTPNLDALAKHGVTFTYFHTSPMCSPSRAMLMTGVEQHRTGYGTMAEFITPSNKNAAGYEGYLNDRVVTIAELLKSGGYRTFMSGKWHLGAKALPSNRGFEQSFVLVQGAGSHFDDKGYNEFTPKVTYLRDGQPATLPKDFYSSDYYADRAIEFIDSGVTSGQPFFGYLAFTAPHWPLHAPADLVKKYDDGRYMIGWDKLRDQRLAALKARGIINNDAEAAPRDHQAPAWDRASSTGAYQPIPAWDTLSPDDQRYEAKLMAVYAAMVERLDWNVGRIVDHLKRTGQYENTIIVFLSDNGPEPVDFNRGHYNNRSVGKSWSATNFDNSLEALGSDKSYPYLGHWTFSAAPAHRFFKSVVTEGGIHSPLILSYPGVADKGTYTRAFTTILDIVPTLLDAAGVPEPNGSFAGKSVEPMGGKSMLPYLRGEKEYVYADHDGAGFELFGNGALIEGDWKVMRLLPPHGDGSWRLFNLARDPAELKDLSKQEPARFEKMVQNYQTYASKNGVVENPGR